MKDSFELVFKPYKQDNSFRMQVEVVHRNNQAIRFRLSGGDKYIVMDKMLTKKTGNWKICESNFELDTNQGEQTAYTIFELQNLLDSFIKNDNNGPAENPKWEH